MAKAILVVGYGPGISSAVAETFGRAGFAVGLVARNPERLAAGVKALGDKGVTAAAFPADASDAAALRAAIGKARSELGPITVLHWNAYGGEPGDVLAAGPETVRGYFAVAVGGLVAAVQATHEDLKASKEGAVLVTNGGLADLSPAVDAYAVNAGFAGLALANAAKHKLVGLLAQRLRDDGIFVGEVTVGSLVKGTAWDNGSATLEPSAVAEAFLRLYRERGESYARVG